MQQSATPKTDPPAVVVPTIQQTVAWRVTKVEVLSEQKLRVQFVDGTQGEVHLGQLLRSSRVDGTLFEALRDQGVFAQAKVTFGAVAWPNGADLAPDAMYDEIREHGCWVVGQGESPG